MRKRLLLIFFIQVNFLFSYNKLDDGFVCLKNYDYFNAKKKFTEQLKKHPTEAAYGLAVIYSRNDNPFHNLDSAYRFIMQAFFSFQGSADKKNRKSKVYSIGSNQIDSLKTKIFNSSYQEFLVKGGNKQLAELERYLSFHYFSVFRSLLLRTRDSLVFTSVLPSFSSDSMNQLISDYPESVFLEKAKDRKQWFQLREKTNENDAESFLRFLDSFPENKYADYCVDKLFSIFQKDKNAEGLLRAIHKFPKHSAVNDSWKMIYSLKVPEYNIENQKKFLTDFPDFPFKNEIEDELRLSNLHLIPVQKGNKFGFIDSIGNIVIQPEFDQVSQFCEGLALAEQNEKFGYINKKGQFAISPEYDEATNFEDGVAVAAKNGNYFILNRNGEIKAGPFQFASEFFEGLLSVKMNEKFGFVNKNGSVLIPCDFEKTGDFKESLCEFLQNSKYGFIDHNGFATIKPVYDWAEPFDRGRSRVKLNGKYGIINKKGEYIVPPEFTRIEKLHVGIFLVVSGEYYGFLDSLGKPVTELKYNFNGNSNPSDFIHSNYLKLITDKGEQILNRKTGKKILPSLPNEVSLPNYGKIIFRKKRKFGIMDENGEVLVSAVYDDIKHFGKNTFIFYKKGEYSIMDSKERLVLRLGNQAPQYLGKTYYSAVVEQTFLLIDCLNAKVVYSGPGFEAQIEEENKMIRISSDEGEFYFYLPLGKIVFSALSRE